MSSSAAVPACAACQASSAAISRLSSAVGFAFAFAAGSQFFILHQDYPLPPNYVIFARVTAGMDVVDALAATPTSMGADGGMSQPVTAPTITTVTIRP